MLARTMMFALASAAAGLLAFGPSSWAAGDAAAGKKIFQTCLLCHTDQKGHNKVGPSLFDIVGRHSASLPDYNYSDAMKNFDKVWTPEELDTYLTNPREVVKGTKMIFPGIKDEKSRQDLIAYLETLK